MPKPWKPEDIEQLRELWPWHRGEDVAVMMRRTRSAVYVKAHELGLRKAPEAAAAIRKSAQAVRKTEPAPVSPEVDAERARGLRKAAARELIEHGVDPTAAELSVFLISRGLIPGVRMGM